uniref:Uncharacterized protein n=1 Tax=Alexandrium catenella TaxID=2925 RepID=A0A7S1WR90_ALECA|mmetsp:Transcript_8399/g.22808  ORF Transcript_8399/g.22808 Transcript_8399/m.22808 type:complete len:235 (+) Transcript_8399:213-917(+)
MAAEPSSQIYVQTMCLCVPLRLGVLISAVLTFLTSLVYVANRQLWEYTFRHCMGGYASSSRVVIGAIEVTGLIVGLLGIVGTWYQKQDYIISFNLWQFARLGAMSFMYVVDIPLLTHCEDWVNDIKHMTEVHGWNQLMYDIAMAGGCDGERVRFLVLSFLTLAVFMYLTWVTLRYQEFMSCVPKHLLRVPKDLSSGAFYAHSLGERAHLSGVYGQHDHNPMQSGQQGGFGSVPL